MWQTARCTIRATLQWKQTDICLTLEIDCHPSSQSSRVEPSRNLTSFPTYQHSSSSPSSHRIASHCQRLSSVACLLSSQWVIEGQGSVVCISNLHANSPLFSPFPLNRFYIQLQRCRASAILRLRTKPCLADHKSPWLFFTPTVEGRLLCHQQQLPFYRRIWICQSWECTWSGINHKCGTPKVFRQLGSIERREL